METQSRVVAALLLFLFLFGGLPPSSATPPAPARIVGGFVSNAFSALLKWLWSLKSTTKTPAVSGRPMMRFEGGYTVETVFDGSKLGIEPFAVEVAPSGELLVLDSANSNIYRISPPLSRYSRPRLVAGSSDGFAGHVDGKLREARMNHPKGFTTDDRGNIYVADTMNMAIRKISDTGVTTIAGGRWSKGGHVDGPSEDAKFSNDFEVVYVGSSCSLIVVDRGNQAIREIQLHFDDCAYQYGSAFPLACRPCTSSLACSNCSRDEVLHLGHSRLSLDIFFIITGIAVLIAAGFFGYMLALLQRRVGGMVSSKTEPRAATKPSIPPSPYQKPFPSVRTPLIPPDDELEKQEEEGLFTSLGKLVAGASSSVTEIFGAFLGLRRKPQPYKHQSQFQQQRRPNTWPVQESYVIQDEDEPPPPTEARTPTPRKTYDFMSKDPEKIHHLKQGRAYFSSWEGELQQQQMHQQHLQPQRHYSSGPQTYYEQSCETTKEIVFGAVQEADSRRAVEIKAVNYEDSIYDRQGLRARMNHMGYCHGY